MATIRIARDDNRLLLDIEDRGKGIPEDKMIEMDSVGMPGIGIRGMRERMRQLGGNLTVSSDKHGTLIQARLPVAGTSSRAAA